MGGERKLPVHSGEAGAPEFGRLPKQCTRPFCSCGDGGGSQAGQNGGSGKVDVLRRSEELPHSLVGTRGPRCNSPS